jgi:hypothetical protein
VRWELAVRSGRVKSTSITADEQTRLLWARAARSYDDVPEIYKSFFDSLPLDKRDPFPYTIITPKFKGFIRPESEKLICNPGDAVYVLEKVGNKLTSICYPLNDIYYIEVGAILLYSWVTITGVDINGALSSSTLKFNLVTDYLITPIVESIRCSTTAGTQANLDAETAHFDSLIHSNFKFMNYARRSVRPGEKVIQTILQPELRLEVFKLFSMPFSRLITTAHLTILTDSELIIIREDEKQGWLKGTRYGGIWYYIPLGKITAVSLTGKDHDLLVLSILLAENQNFDSLFQASKKSELELLLKQLESQAHETVTTGAIYPG